jgi:hypothetical protein
MKPKVIASPGCGNSPKNSLVQAVAIAVETFDHAALSRLVVDDVTWEIPGRHDIEGRSAVLERLAASATAQARKVVIRRVLSHGRAGAVDGLVVLASGLTRAFCHVLEFSSAKGQHVSSICSYYSETSAVPVDRGA